MNTRDNGCLIGVDGGGTQSRFAVWHDARRTELRRAALNVATNPAGAVARLVEGLVSLAEEAGLSTAERRSSRIYLGLAGITDPAAADAIRARIAAVFPGARIAVEDDRPAAVAGALGEGDGTVIGIGTGSFLARQHQGSVRLLGGWGATLGDEASGAWLGRAALARVLRMCDGLVPATPMLQALLAEFDGAPSRIVAFAGSAGPDAFGSYAPRIAGAAANGDGAALALMQEGADYIAHALTAIGWQAGEPVCLMGGLAPRYAAWLPEAARAALLPPRGTGLDGALLCARRIARADNEDRSPGAAQ